MPRHCVVNLITLSERQQWLSQVSLGPSHSSMARYRMSTQGPSGLDVPTPRGIWRQSKYQWFSWWHLGYGLGDLWGIREAWAQKSPDCIWNRDPGALRLWKAREPGQLLWPFKKSSLAQVCLGAFSLLPWYTLKALLKLCSGVRGPFPRCLSLALVSGNLWKKWVIWSCFLSGVLGSRLIYYKSVFIGQSMNWDGISYLPQFCLIFFIILSL